MRNPLRRGMGCCRPTARWQDKPRRRTWRFLESPQSGWPGAVVMSANLDLVRSIYAALARGDFGVAEWTHPQIAFVIADGPDPGSWTGKADMAKAAREHLNVWEGYRIKADEYRQLDDERVLVLVHRTGRGKASGFEAR